jgi:hypothetical protein
LEETETILSPKSIAKTRLAERAADMCDLPRKLTYKDLRVLAQHFAG